MNLRVYDTDLNKTVELENRYISCLWEEGYNSVEPFSLELADTPFLRQNVKEEYFVGRSDRNTIMYIENIQYVNDRIICTGRQATQLLEHVGFADTIKENSLIGTAIPTAYFNTSKVKNLVFEKNTKLLDKYPNQISNKSMLEITETVCKNNDVGVRVIRNEKQLVAQLYKPTTRPAAIFSNFIGNIAPLEIYKANENYKNYAIVLGEGKSKERIRLDVDLTNGAEHRELIIDARDLQQEEKETLEAYKKRLATRGIEKLLECPQVVDIKINVSDKDFGKLYDLGSLVTIIQNDIRVQARIVRFTQKSQNNEIITTIEVGQLGGKK